MYKHVSHRNMSFHGKSFALMAKSTITPMITEKWRNYKCNLIKSGKAGRKHRFLMRFAFFDVFSRLTTIATLVVLCGTSRMPCLHETHLPEVN